MRPFIVMMLVATASFAQGTSNRPTGCAPNTSCVLSALIVSGTTTLGTTTLGTTTCGALTASSAHIVGVTQLDGATDAGVVTVTTLNAIGISNLGTGTTNYLAITGGLTPSITVAGGGNIGISLATSGSGTLGVPGVVATGSISVTGTNSVIGYKKSYAGFGLANYIDLDGAVTGTPPTISCLGDANIDCNIVTGTGAVRVVGIKFGGSTDVMGARYKGTTTLDFGSIAAGACAELTAAETGVAIADRCTAGAPATIESNLGWQCYISATDVVTIRVCNFQLIAAIDPASATWTYEVSR